MSTPKFVTDGVDDMDEAVVNHALYVPKVEVKINYCEITFTAAGNTVAVNAVDSDGEIVSGDCAWDAGNTRINITLTGFTATPIVIAALKSNASTNAVLVRSNGGSSSQAQIHFDDGAGSAVDPDGDVEVVLIVIGV
jgi:hypothetical protein